MNRFFLFALPVLFLLSSCNKNKLSDVQASEDDVFAQAKSCELLALINQYATQYFHLQDTVLLNPIITVSGDTFPKEMKVLFNSESSPINGGSFLGEITVSSTDSVFTQGNYIEFSFNNFQIDDFKISGSYSLTVDTITPQFTEYSCKVNSAKFKFPEAIEFSWNMDQIVLLNRGATIPDSFVNDEYQFYGISSGTSKSNRNFSSGIIAPLVFKNSCWSVVEGKKELIPLELSLRLINFGNGDCIRRATITSDGEDYYFEF